jgi:GR25 family glycosyltransferase involved in LPS biosynthesis
MSLNGINVIYWINLDRSTERRNNMENIFADGSFDNIEKIRFPAIDGKNENLVDSILDVPKKSISYVEYACLLSHLEAIHTFLNSDYENALIMEDDVTLDFKKYWKKDLKEIIDNAPMDWEIIMLTYISNKIPEEEYIFNRNEYWSAMAYIINKKGAKRLIENTYIDNKYKIDPSINNESDQYIFQKINTYVYKYPYFIYKYGENSTLHQSAVKRHDASRQRIEDMYAIEYKGDTIEGFSKYDISDDYSEYNLKNSKYKWIYIFIFILLCIFIIYGIYNVLVLLLTIVKLKSNKLKIFRKK